MSETLNHDSDEFAFKLPEGVEEGDHVMEFQIPGKAALTMAELALTGEIKMVED